MRHFLSYVLRELYDKRTCQQQNTITTKNHTTMNECSSSTSNKRKRDDITENDVPQTVKLNVGGKHFEVSRSLILDDDGVNTTMLSRLVSDTWLKEPEKPVFIDRNGDHFSYVLDYLRYGTVSLPRNISMDNFLKDMDFFCIPVKEQSVKQDIGSSGVFNETNQFKEDISRLENVVNEKETAVKEAEALLKSRKRELGLAKGDLNRARRQLSKEHEHVDMATKLLNHYHNETRNGSTEVKVLPFSNSINYFLESPPDRDRDRDRGRDRGRHTYTIGKEQVFHYTFKEATLNKYLGKFGLSVTGWKTRDNCVLKLL